MLLSCYPILHVYTRHTIWPLCTIHLILLNLQLKLFVVIMQGAASVCTQYHRVNGSYNLVRPHHFCFTSCQRISCWNLFVFTVGLTFMQRSNNGVQTPPVHTSRRRSRVTPTVRPPTRSLVLATFFVCLNLPFVFLVFIFFCQKLASNILAPLWSAFVPCA